jgi:hypothetical protein
VRFPTDADLRIVLLSVALAALLTGGVVAQRDSSAGAPIPAASGSTGIDDAEIARALAAVKADPNLATQQTIKLLRWRSPMARRPTEHGLLEWLAGLARWLDQSARVLMWVALAVLAAVIAAFLVKAFHGPEPIASAGSGRVVSSHVQGLDIRSETLPGDIGLAARQLWDRGEHRAALALLYRGLLSRLVHVHRLPVRDSSTEVDCLALATRLGARGAAYSARLIATWQAFVYEHANAETSTVYSLCDEFSLSLDSRSASLTAGDEA